MARIQTREQLVNYCLRRLGAPVIQINVAPEQLDDRVEDALHKFAEYHYNGTNRAYIKHQVTAQDKINQYIILPENIIGAVDIFPLQGFASTGQDMFDVRYQIAMNDLYTLSGTNLVPYAMTMTQLATMNEMLIGKVPIRYNRRNGNKLYLDMDWNNTGVGTWLIIEAFEVVDPEEFDGVYDEQWLKDYLTALIKKQWGTNLSKFQGMALPGGMVLNGLEIIQQADREIAEAQTTLERNYVMPPLDRMG
jgi:hypothetical protein